MIQLTIEDSTLWSRIQGQTVLQSNMYKPLVDQGFYACIQLRNILELSPLDDVTELNRAILH